MSKSFSTVGFKWLHTAKISRNKYDHDSLRSCVLEANLEDRKELQELHNNYPLSPDKLEIKKEMLYDYQWKIAADCNISVGNFKKSVPDFFDNESYVLH